jgi:hypothetical protein
MKQRKPRRVIRKQCENDGCVSKAKLGHDFCSKDRCIRKSGRTVTSKVSGRVKQRSTDLKAAANLFELENQLERLNAAKPPKKKGKTKK